MEDDLSEDVGFEGKTEREDEGMETGGITSPLASQRNSQLDVRGGFIMVTPSVTTRSVGLRI